jgi:hypothetical protein
MKFIYCSVERYWCEKQKSNKLFCNGNECLLNLGMSFQK